MTKAHAQTLGGAEWAEPKGAGTFSPWEGSAGDGRGGAAHVRASRRSQGAGRRRLGRTMIVKRGGGAQGCVPPRQGSSELHKTTEPLAVETVILPRGLVRPGGSKSHT